MVRRVWGLVGLLGFLCLALTSAGPELYPPPGLFVQYEGECLTIKAQAVPQRQILEALAHQLHFELRLMGPLEERQSVEVDRRPWEEGLKRALAPANWVALYRATTEPPQLSHVWVWPRAQEPPVKAPSPVPPSQPPEMQTPLPSAPGRYELSASPPVLLVSETDEARAVALATLANLGGELAVEAVTQTLHEEAPWLREIAVEALASLGGESAIQGLQQVLEDENIEVQQAAQDALARLLSAGE
jgi:hypothetical protein